jgi:hypothetical protein
VFSFLYRCFFIKKYHKVLCGAVKNSSKNCYHAGKSAGFGNYNYYTGKQHYYFLIFFCSAGIAPIPSFCFETHNILDSLYFYFLFLGPISEELLFRGILLDEMTLPTL